MVRYGIETRRLTSLHRIRFVSCGIRNLSCSILGGEKMTLKREKVMKELGEHKAFTGDEYDLSTAEKRERYVTYSRA